MAKKEDAPEGVPPSGGKEEASSSKDVLSEESKEVSELEKEIIEEEEQERDTEFHDTLQPSQQTRSSPVLERVVGQEALRQPVIISPSGADRDKEDEIKYSAADKKYEETQIYEVDNDPNKIRDLINPSNPNQVNLESVGRGDVRSQLREVGNITAIRGAPSVNQDYENVRDPARVDMGKVGRGHQDTVKKYEVDKKGVRT